MKFFDPKPEYLQCSSAIDLAMKEVIDSCSFINGKAILNFEKAISSYLMLSDNASSIAVSSGTDALVLALKACGIGKGDEVILIPILII